MPEAAYGGQIFPTYNEILKRYTLLSTCRYRPEAVALPPVTSAVAEPSASEFNCVSSLALDSLQLSGASGVHPCSQIHRRKHAVFHRAGVR